MPVWYRFIRLYVVAKKIQLNQLTKHLKSAIENEKAAIKKNGETAVRMAAIKTFSKIIKMTPVGNSDNWKTPIKPVGYVGGRARSNWMLGSSLTNETTDATNITLNVADELPNKLMDNKTYFYNNLPYINRLEYGSHSKQAPNGMVRISLLGWGRTLNESFKGLS